MEKLIHGMARLLAVLSAVAIVVMVIAIAVDVFVRNATGASLPGMIEIAETSMVTAVAFGLAWAGVNGEHVAVTLLTDRFNPTWARATNIFIWALVAFYTAWLSYANILNSVQATQAGEIRFGLVQWPMYPMRWILTLGFISLLLVALANLYRCLTHKEPMGFSDELEAVLAEEPMPETTENETPENVEGGRTS
ncbi:MAG: TRAP transporter small permease [Yaniella sp.]|uniref:TRAP transporter small permease n=1 Tax=Yaniella sp. TaxID=2773929 RepID=UPI001F867156|nr:TRAP transporter small permease [Yaniella sp.]HIY86236.1 TRAP transporter small permease [Candidatus Yaniella excrementavium]MDN5731806.1 TRAP transporter small permease [Yaniella sp.]MDN5816613.1 TRAP transporter small permease [Yaniella sp.]MDN5818999.1 TRAP transporter small permease [Yaniella sp.]MDN6637412.1 TRAP transporter small permease [Yaniella sp.]